MDLNLLFNGRFITVVHMLRFTNLVPLSMPDGVEELLIIENLDGFTKDNADNRMVKYLLEIVQVRFFLALWSTCTYVIDRITILGV